MRNRIPSFKMPKAISYTPAWLSKPNPGYEIFSPVSPKPTTASAHRSSASVNTSRKRTAKPGPRRTIARRGTEIFTAVGKEIRWADLVYLKEAWENKQPKERRSRKQLEEEISQYDEDHAQGYRTLRVSQIAEDIRQLVISPQSNYLAILTTHNVLIAVLPESSHLTAPDTGPMKLKTFTLGPTTHVTSQSGIATALWHPLGVQGQCLVTVTEDAIVRVWELSTGDRWSFDKPTLSIDLKKLADGTSLDQDFGASVSGQSKGFTPDSVEMEVASACFAGRNSGGWSPMTLWVAMKEGDVYALCPLLPEKWSPPAALIPSLSISVIAKTAALEDQLNPSSQERQLAQQQMAWMGDLDLQEPSLQETSLGEPPVEVYTRPAKPGKVPKLQGPFHFELAPEESEDGLDDLLTDIFVIGPKIDSEELMNGEEDDLELDGMDQEGGLSVGVVCLLTPSGRLWVCLDMDGIEAQWLPKSKSKSLRILDEAEPPELLTFQVLDTLKSGEFWDGNWPMFSADVNSGYSFFITNTSSVTFISLSPWVFRLETELSGEAAGGEFRLDVLAKGQSTIRERVYTGKTKSNDHSLALAASTLIRDPDLGYFLLTATQYGPHAISFELPEVEDYNLMQRSRSPTYEELENDKPLIICEPRPVYQPPYELEVPSKLPDLLKNLRHGSHKRILKENVRLSKATFQIMNEAHILLGDETHRLGTAAAELFRRCELLQIELQSQIKKAHEVAARVDAIAGDNVDEDTLVSTDEAVDTRIMNVKTRQKELTERVERLKKKAGRATGSKELTEKEKSWVEEVKRYRWKVLGEGEPPVGGEEVSREPFERYHEVEALEKELFEEVKGMSAAENGDNGDEGSGKGVKVPSEVRRRKEREVMKALERETALVEGAKMRLERLSLV